MSQEGKPSTVVLVTKYVIISAFEKVNRDKAESDTHGNVSFIGFHSLIPTSSAGSRSEILLDTTVFFSGSTRLSDHSFAIYACTLQ